MNDLDLIEAINETPKRGNGMIGKIIRVALIILAVGSVLGGVVKFAPWETTDFVAVVNKEQDKRITDTEKNVIELKGDIETIDERTKNMEKLQYIILKEVRK